MAVLQVKKQERQWAEEKGNLTAKLERLHKMNADKRQEIEQLKGQADQLRAQLAAAHQESASQANTSSQVTFCGPSRPPGPPSVHNLSKEGVRTTPSLDPVLKPGCLFDTCCLFNPCCLFDACCLVDPCCLFDACCLFDPRCLFDPCCLFQPVLPG
jgi:hypothetical protein